MYIRVALCTLTKCTFILFVDSLRFQLIGNMSYKKSTFLKPYKVFYCVIRNYKPGMKHFFFSLVFISVDA